MTVYCTACREKNGNKNILYKPEEGIERGKCD